MPPTGRLIATTAVALILSPLFVSSPFAGETIVGDIRIIEPWARATAGAATAGAAYMTLNNTGATADRLIEASSPVAARTEMHTHIIEGDIMRMRAVESVDLPPGETVEFQPGGLHVMLIGLKAALQEGESFPLTLNFAEAGATTMEVKVLQPGAVEPGREQAREQPSGDRPGHGHGAQGREQTPADGGMEHAH
jgi:copper(I)-binding protein